MGRVIWEIILGSLSGNEDREGSKVNKRHVNKWDTAGDTGVTPSFWEPFEKPYRTCSWGGMVKQSTIATSKPRRTEEMWGRTLAESAIVFFPFLSINQRIY